MNKIKIITNVTYSTILLIVGAVALNFLGSFVPLRFDVTKEKSYTLSEGTKKILKKIESDIEIKYYYSRSLRETPLPFKNYGSRVEQLLRDFNKVSSGKIKLQAVDPKPDTDEEEWARKYGISPVRLQKGDEFFFGLVFLKGKQEEVIPYLDPRREEQLEYDLAETLVRLNGSSKTKVGVFSSLSIWGNPMAGVPSWAFVDELKKNYEVIDLNSDFNALSQTNVAILLHPKNLDEKVQYQLDQFVVGGGRLIVALDPFSRTDLASVAQMQDQQAMMQYEPSSMMQKPFDAWGIAFNPGSIVGDQGQATMINTEMGSLAYPFFISLGASGLSKTNRITSQLGSMLLAESGEVTVTAKEGLKWEALIETSKDAGSSEGKMLRFVGPMNFAQSFKVSGGVKVLAGILSGKFSSAFGGMPAGVGSPQGSAHLAQAQKEGMVLVVGDVDFLADANSVDRFRFGNQIVSRPKNDNLSFLLNAVEYMGGQDDLISIRSRGKLNRPFTRIVTLQKEAQQKWKNVEDELSQKISDLQKGINDMQQQRTDSGQITLSPEQQVEISKFREEEALLRKKRREVRKNLREDIEKLENHMVFANMVPIPIMVILTAFVVFRKRSRQLKEGQGND